jgi:carbon-monoxide dehydrogenase medium subunit
VLPAFSILRPRSLDEACGLLAEHRDDAAAYAGGSELLLAMKLGLANYNVLIDLKGLPELSTLVVGDDLLRIGAAVTHRQLERHPEIGRVLPSLVGMERQVANSRVRAVGTLGGNLAFGEPHSDPATFLCVLHARYLCHNADGQYRLITAADFLRSPFETALRPDEIIAQVQVPVPGPETGIAHRRFVLTERPVAIATALIRAERGAITEARLAVGAVGPRPALVPDIGRILVGEPLELGEDVLDAVSELVRETVVFGEGDSADYVRHLAGVLSRRSVFEAAGKCRPAHD